MSELANWNFAALGSFLGAVAFAVAAFRYIVGVRDALNAKIELTKEVVNTRITTEAEKAAQKTDAVIEHSRLMIEAVRETEGRSRNELAATLQTALGEVRRDTRALDEKVTQMRVEMVRRPDLAEAVKSLLDALDRQEKRFEGLLTKSVVSTNLR
jgi:hypothetical protein